MKKTPVCETLVWSLADRVKNLIEKKMTRSVKQWYGHWWVNWLCAHPPLSGIATSVWIDLSIMLRSTYVLWCVNTFLLILRHFLYFSGGNANYFSDNPCIHFSCFSPIFSCLRSWHFQQLSITGTLSSLASSALLAAQHPWHFQQLSIPGHSAQSVHRLIRHCLDVGILGRKYWYFSV